MMNAKKSNQDISGASIYVYIKIFGCRIRWVIFDTSLVNIF